MLEPARGFPDSARMDFLRVMDVLVICIPVFAVMGLGKLLERKDVLTDDRCSFIKCNKLCTAYHIYIN